MIMIVLDLFFFAFCCLSVIIKMPLQQQLFIMCDN